MGGNGGMEKCNYITILKIKLKKRKILSSEFMKNWLVSRGDQFGDWGWVVLTLVFADEFSLFVLRSVHCNEFLRQLLSHVLCPFLSIPWTLCLLTVLELESQPLSCALISSQNVLPVLFYTSCPRKQCFEMSAWPFQHTRSTSMFYLDKSSFDIPKWSVLTLKRMHFA